MRKQPSVKTLRGIGMTIAAVAAVVVASGQSSPAAAGPGHDHGDAPAQASGNSPKREASGIVFLPKPSQRQLGVRTTRASVTEEPRAYLLPGQVIIDPTTGGRVQSTQAGRLAPAAAGMPLLGQRVRQGEVLAYVLPTVASIDAANQTAASAEIAAALQNAKQRLGRLEQLQGSVPQREIDEARVTVESLRQRSDAVTASTRPREALIAPVAGVIASVAPSAVAGQVIDAREVLFEIVNPAKLTIEAMAADARVSSDIAAGSIYVANQRIALTFFGAARALREGQVPLLFRRTLTNTKTAELNVPLAVGESVKVTVQTRSKQSGIAVPAAALVKSPANQDIVWVNESPERFAPRTVIWKPLDGERVLITAGLKADERVVVTGAPLINQVR